MRQIRFVLLLLVTTSLMFACTELKPVSPPSPTIVGKWKRGKYEVSDLPAWYVAKNRLDSIVKSPTYTIYDAGWLAITQNVLSYTFNNNGTFLEEYTINGGLYNLGMKKTIIDRGTWMLTDSGVTLNVANDHPHELVYSPTTNELATDKFRQTAVLQNIDMSIDTVFYTIRLFYHRSQ